MFRKLSYIVDARESNTKPPRHLSRHIAAHDVRVHRRLLNIAPHPTRATSDPTRRPADSDSAGCRDGLMVRPWIQRPPYLDRHDL